MYGPVYSRWLPPNVLHNVDLSTSRPADCVDVVTQHPERGPDALSAWDLDSSFETAIFEVEFSFCDQSGGSVLARSIPATQRKRREELNGFDNERTRAVQESVFSG